MGIDLVASATLPIVIDGHHCWSPMGEVCTQAFVLEILKTERLVRVSC